MQLIIEVSGGCVTSVYHRRNKNDNIKPAGIPDVFVIDLDLERVGEGNGPQQIEVESLAGAPAPVIEAMEEIKST